jgi:hypothetical protein
MSFTFKKDAYMKPFIITFVPAVFMYPNAYSRGRSASSQREADILKLVFREKPS